MKKTLRQLTTLALAGGLLAISQTGSAESTYGYSVRRYRYSHGYC